MREEGAYLQVLGVLGSKDFRIYTSLLRYVT